MRRAVVDQPGLKIIFFGLIVAIFLGLTVRSQITNYKVNEFVRNAAQDIEKNNQAKKLSIDFAEAQLLLSDWGLPFPHLLIKNIKISAAVSECADNQIYIETLDIPISWMNLFKLRLQVETARVGLVELRLNNPEDCFNQAASPVPVSRTSASTVSAAPAQELPPSPQEFNVYIEKLKIIDKHNYNIPVLLQTVGARITVVGGTISDLDLRSQIYLFRDFDQSIYKLKSDLTFNFSPHEAAATIRGKLIDKPFEVNLSWSKPQNKILISHKLKDLSVKALMSLSAQNEGHQFEGVSGLALSQQGHGELNLASKTLEYYQIENLVVSSGESLATVEQIYLTSVKPVAFRPFEIKIQNFELEKLKSLPAFSSIQRSISDFGKISGVMTLRSPTDITAEGTLQGLQMIFSNRGQRANQKIDELAYQLNNQNLILSQIVMEGQPVKGQVKLSLKPLSIQAELSNIRLADQVYDIFSFTASQSTKVDVSLSGNENLVKSKIKLDQLSSPSMEVTQAEVNYESLPRQRSYNFEVNVKELKINRSDVLDPSFYQVLESLGDPAASHFVFEGVKAQYQAQRQAQTPEEIALKITAHADKNKLLMRSEFRNSNRALFKVDLTNHNKALKSFEFNANLSNFTFELIK